MRKREREKTGGECHKTGREGKSAAARSRLLARARPSLSPPPPPPPPPPLSTRASLSTQGERSSTDFRIFLESAKAPGTPISVWHDIPLANPDGTLNFVCEIPAESSAKMEVSTKEGANPIKQDIKKGALRFYPYNINWNYGMLPQTWEDPKIVHPELEVAVRCGQRERETRGTKKRGGGGRGREGGGRCLPLSLLLLPPLSLSLSRVTRAWPRTHTQNSYKRGRG